MSLSPEIERQVETLHSSKAKWAATSPKERVEYIDELLGELGKIDSVAWAHHAMAAEGFDPTEETHLTRTMRSYHTMGPVFMTSGLLKKFRGSYAEAANKEALKPLPVRRVAGSEFVAAKVLPWDADDALLGLYGIKGELWISDASAKHATRSLPTPHPGGKVSLVMSAGNNESISLVDTLDRLFGAGEVVMIKAHDIRASIAFMEQIFAPLIRDGFVAICEGGLAVSQALVAHPKVGHVHVTGGVATANAIIWGPPDEQAARKQMGTPVLLKSITTELGNISPIIVASGGDWSDSDLKYQASHCAASHAWQNSCNCLAPKLIILGESWVHRARFEALIREELANTHEYPPYYPGTQDRYRRFAEAYPHAEYFSAGPGVRPPASGVWTAAPNNREIGAPTKYMLLSIDGASAEPDEYCLRNEAFANVLTLVTLPDASPKAFLDAAADFCNTKVWGTLKATVIMHPSLTSAQPELEDRVCANLKYGMVGINCTGYISYAGFTTVWGGYPGEALDTLQSGQGFIKNTLMVDNIQKAVVKAPFRCTMHTLREKEFLFSPELSAALAPVMAKPTSITRVGKLLFTLFTTGVGLSSKAEG